VTEVRKIALVSSYIPFVQGGARNIVEWLAIKLREQGLEVSIVWIPQLDTQSTLINQMLVFKWLNLDEADMVITFRPMSHLIQHRNKVIWFIHHIRPYYDYWDSPHRGFPRDSKHQAFQNLLYDIDTRAIGGAKKVFTNSKEVQGRLKNFNNIDSEVLYPPIFDSHKYLNAGHNDEVICIGRLESHKRPDLFIRALAKTSSAVRLRFLGVASDSAYLAELKKLIVKLKLQERVSLENRWVSESEKIDALSNCLATIYAPDNEDSYGYASLESAYSEKPIITTSDAGGVTELVIHKYNGWISEPTEFALANIFDEAINDPRQTQIMGINALERLGKLEISWDHVLRRLLE
jgi:glycosyltransferase involved in cell wall biosynthesis